MPASYPQTIKVFTTGTGPADSGEAMELDQHDIAYAANVNELRLEVAAIETALGANSDSWRNHGTLLAYVDFIAANYSGSNHEHTQLPTTISFNLVGSPNWTPTTGAYLGINGAQIQGYSSGTAVGILTINAGGGDVHIGTATDNTQVYGSLGVNGPGSFAGNVQIGGYILDIYNRSIRDPSGGWVRTYGATGWYNGDYGGGWYMADSTYIRAYGDKQVYTGSAIRAGTAVIKTNAAAGLATFSTTGYEDSITGYGFLHSGLDTYINHLGGSTNYVHIRENNFDLATWRFSPAGICEFRLYNIPALTGGAYMTIQPSPSLQVGYLASSIQFKEAVRDLDKSKANNPVFRMRATNFRWKKGTISNVEDRSADQIPDREGTGLIAEEVDEVAPEAVVRDGDGKPVSLDLSVLVTYLVDAVNHLRDEVATLKMRLAE